MHKLSSSFLYHPAPGREFCSKLKGFCAFEILHTALQFRWLSALFLLFITLSPDVQFCFEQKVGLEIAEVSSNLHGCNSCPFWSSLAPQHFMLLFLNNSPNQIVTSGTELVKVKLLLHHTPRPSSQSAS